MWRPGKATTPWNPCSIFMVNSNTETMIGGASSCLRQNAGSVLVFYFPWCGKHGTAFMSNRGIKKTKTKLRVATASLTGFPTTSWSSARWFSPSSLHMLQSEPTWSWRKTLLWQAAIHFYYGLILIPIGDWNDHISAAISVYSNAHGGQGFSTCNSEIEDSGICNSQWSLHHQHLVQEERLTSNHLKLSWPFNPSKLYFIATASAVQSAMWKSSLTRSASNSTT